MRARVLLNPAAGAGRGRRAAARLAELARAAAGGTELVESASGADLERQARRAVDEGIERLIVAGGDGTFHQAIQGLAGGPCELALVPLGSGNDLAGSLGVPLGLEAACELALAGRARPLDLGRAGERWFASYCGVGFDSEASRAAQDPPPFVRGPAIYVWGVLRALFGFVPPGVVVEHDGGVIEGRMMFVVAANCARFGGGMRIAPQADPADGLLDLVVVREVSRLALLRAFPRVYRGRHLDHPAVATARTKRARIRLDREMVMFSDGEELFPVGPEGVEVTAREGALRVVTSG